MPKVPSLDDVEAMDDDTVIDLESKLVEQTDNGPREEDGPEPAQDESPGLENQED